MGQINIPQDQQIAITAIDDSELDRLIDQAIRDEQSGALHRLALANCGPYIATNLHSFDRALTNHRQAKAPRKRAETEEALRRAGNDLSFAVRAMKQRVENEQTEARLFIIDDHIIPPQIFSNHLSVQVGYRWRRTVEDEWKFGHITFVHHVDLRPDYTMPVPKRKPSAAKREHDKQNTLYQTWEHLMSGALYSVREYFRAGGDGGNIPELFQATVDSYTRELNNYSTQFWRHRSE